MNGLLMSVVTDSYHHTLMINVLFERQDNKKMYCMECILIINGIGCVAMF